MSLAKAVTLHIEPSKLPGEQSSRAAVGSNRLQDYWMIAKPRLSMLVLLTTMVGFYFGSVRGLNVGLMLDVLFGTALVAFGSGALNQCIEIRADGLMRRTENRPLPTGRLSYSEVLYFGVTVSIAGMLYLAVRVDEWTALLAALTLVLYVFAYTPLKRISSLNTLVGALPGALPPLIGYVAARGKLDWPAYTLFAILFIWQLPHFLAIAWLYRADYAKAGMRMLPNDDPDGIATGIQMFVHSMTLLPLSMLPFYFRMAGSLYIVGAMVLGLIYLSCSVLFLFKRNDAAARKVFLASVVYLPLLLSLMMFDSVN